MINHIAQYAAFLRNNPVLVTLLLTPWLLTSCVQDFVKIERGQNASEDSARAYMAKSYSLRDTDPVSSLEMAEKAVLADPKLLQAVRTAGVLSLYLAQKDESNRQRYVDKAIKYAGMLQDEHDTADSNYMYGMAYHYRNSSLAIEYLKKAMNDKINPTNSAFMRSESDRNSTYAAIGFEYGSLQDYKNCLLYFKQFMKYCEHDPQRIETVKLVRPLIPQLELYLHYNKLYEPGGGATSHDSKVKETGKNSRKSPMPEEVKPASKTTEASSSRRPPVSRQEYERIKEELKKAFSNRDKEIERLTG